MSGPQLAGGCCWALAAGAAGAAIYFDVERQAARSDAMHADTRQDFEDSAADYDHARVAEMVSLGAAVGLAGLGVTLLVLDAQEGSSVALGIGTDRAGRSPIGGSVRLTGSF